MDVKINRASQEYATIKVNRPLTLSESLANLNAQKINTKRQYHTARTAKNVISDILYKY